MKRHSRYPGFHKLTIQQRRKSLQPQSGLSEEQLEECLCDGGLDASTADAMVENSLGIYSLPFGVALNFTINGQDRLVPMVVEEPSVIAAASNAARMARSSGGFFAETLGVQMTAQVQLYAVASPVKARQHLLDRSGELLELAAGAVPSLVARGGGPRALEVRDLGDGYLVVHVQVDCLDAMGANLVNTIAERIGPRVAELADGKLGLCILSNLCDARRVRVGACVHARELGTAEHTGEEVVEKIECASRFAGKDPYRAATHNKGIMNGVDSVVIATGNDYRAAEAGAHAYASRSGSYQPLAVWRRIGSYLVGELELPLALGVVGGTSQLHPTARLSLRLAGVETAAELAHVAASAGLASNLAALRALVTHGIQRGHMSLHARSVARLAGARDDEIAALAQGLFEQRSYNTETARRLLRELRAPVTLSPPPSAVSRSSRVLQEGPSEMEPRAAAAGDR